jgi:hypothetical protein
VLFGKFLKAGVFGGNGINSGRYGGEHKIAIGVAVASEDRGGGVGSQSHGSARDWAAGLIGDGAGNGAIDLSEHNGRKKQNSKERVSQHG